MQNKYYAVIFNTTEGAVGRVVESGAPEQPGEHIVDVDPHPYATIKDAFKALNALCVANDLV